MPITLKRKASETDLPRPSSAVPSTLPPSVEEAYRRKCVQLKNRTNEVEDTNDAARLRLARIKRQVEKLRIERAFLLEQLAKRTSTNVEDSDGSPSPPPTDLASLAELMVNPRKPKDKPLRTKRGHRKSMAVDVDAKATAGSFTTNQAQSPTSETASHPPDNHAKDAHANGVSGSSKKPADAFEIYCDENRQALEAKKNEGDEDDLDVEDELARSWRELPGSEKEEFQTKFEQAVAKKVEKERLSSPKGENEEENDDKEVDDGKEANDDKDDGDDKEEKEDKGEVEEKEDDDEKNDEDEKSEEAKKPQTEDEDVEMGNYDDTED
ncbi:hypothetical protein AK830_g3075 [Neonectria ditissima]|uniref:HMG box domain-containing protein n=1 Tax=Neonectria ditissima TaxID=78410 RepID=A0A0N8H840_9HYPO|nr:hypothetical protein AK830_g3075 [Neonectria ditissima]